MPLTQLHSNASWKPTKEDRCLSEYGLRNITRREVRQLARMLLLRLTVDTLFSHTYNTVTYLDTAGWLHVVWRVNFCCWSSIPPGPKHANMVSV